MSIPGGVAGDVVEPKVKRKVNFTFHFLKFGEIETKKQQFNAEVLIEAWWYEPQVASVVSSGEPFFSGSIWDPRLKIVNLESIQSDWDHSEYIIRLDKSGNPYVLFTRRLRGYFFEKMELSDFPRDVQDLSITVASELGTDEVELVEDQESLSTLNKEIFQDEQNWKLFTHIEITQTIPDPRKKDRVYSVPIISATCRVARKPYFYFWNNYFIMMCLLFLSLCCFSIDRNDIKYRIATLLTLLLTAVAFKLSTAGQLPMISYTTRLDVYMFCNMVFLVFITVHVSVSYLYKGRSFAERIDNISFVVIASLLVSYHLLYLVYFLTSTGKRLKDMAVLDRKFCEDSELRTVRKKLVNNTLTLHDELPIVLDEPQEQRRPRLSSQIQPQLNDEVNVVIEGR
jgi:hypothetical protein